MQTVLHDEQEALRLKEQKVAKEVVVVSVGPKSSQVTPIQKPSKPVDVLLLLCPSSKLDMGCCCIAGHNTNCAGYGS